MERIHIVGASRSGTTLMHELMTTCFKIDGATKEEVRLWRLYDTSAATWPAFIKHGGAKCAAVWEYV